ncbi:MAG TPA: hypothetical protein DCZ12_00400, partial [Gammaproteobacteria bacterium]|nr:hypothetical protein [Gammaproteobacteria bacterium]
GGAILSEILPAELPFEMVDKEMSKKAISNLINASYRNAGLKNTVVFVDRLLYTGFRYATKAGVSIGMNDMVIPSLKLDIVTKSEDEVKEIDD